MEGLKIGCVFAACAASGRKEGYIHSVFDRVVNFEFAGLDAPDPMISIGLADVPVTPAMLVADTPPGFSWRRCALQPGDRVLLAGKCIRTGTLMLSFSTASVWVPAPRPKGAVCCPRHIRDIAHTLTSPADIPAKRRLRAAVLRDMPGLGSPLDFALWEGITGLDAYLHGTADAQTAVDGLIGLGDGLTPTGDDILTGALQGLLYSDKLTLFDPLAAAVRRSMKHTNRISRHFLAYAAHGFWGIREQALLAALFSPDTEGLIEKAAAFTAVGASSGMDQLLGLLLSLQAGGEICLLPSEQP